MNDNNKPYNVSVNGTVTAIHIWLENNHKPMAVLAFAYGGSHLIEWDNVGVRQKYKAGINAYTLYFDDRVKDHDFELFLR